MVGVTYQEIHLLRYFKILCLVLLNKQLDFMERRQVGIDIRSRQF